MKLVFGKWELFFNPTKAPRATQFDHLSGADYLLPTSSRYRALRQRDLTPSWSDGTTHLILSPLELIEKLATLVPPPRLNLIRYHGVLAPNAADRIGATRSPTAIRLRLILFG